MWLFMYSKVMLSGRLLCRLFISVGVKTVLCTSLIWGMMNLQWIILPFHHFVLLIWICDIFHVMFHKNKMSIKLESRENVWSVRDWSVLLFSRLLFHIFFIYFTGLAALKEGYWVWLVNLHVSHYWAGLCWSFLEL